MICPKCGHETSGNFCSNCGTLMKKIQFPTEEEHRYGRGTEGRRVKAWAPENEETGEGTAAGSKIVAGERPAADVRTAAGERSAAGARYADSRTASTEAAERTETRAERRESLRKTGKSRKASGKDSGRKASQKDSGKSEPSRKEVRLEQKEKKLREGRIRRLEGEVERLSVQPSVKDRDGSRREERGSDSASSGPDLGEMAAKGVAGTVVLISRVMQIISCLLMGVMAVTMLRSFLTHGNDLGSIHTMVAEQNYGLALYVGFAGITLFMGVIWCLWILSRKGAGGGFRLKKYDTGRGLIPFLICGAAVLAAGPALTLIPQTDLVSGSWQGIVSGGRAALTAVAVHRASLLFCSGAGAVLSLIRRILLV